MSKPEAPFRIWETSRDLEDYQDVVEGYEGVGSSTANRRSFLDIEPNISVRPSYTSDDYYRFRPDEDPNGSNKHILRKCMRAYDRVGIVKNVIDLMGDFGSQGITLNHPNKSIERFYRRWWEKVNGTERSERFLNNLYRCGNVIINKRYGKITKRQQREMAKAADLEQMPKRRVQKRTLPIRYDFLNPLLVEAEGITTDAIAGDRVYTMKISKKISRAYNGNRERYKGLPVKIRQALEQGKTKFTLDTESLEIFHYKKDDWAIWADPMISAVIDDITMLEKMKLADMSALDGAISNIRLWRLGNLEHKILPNRGAIDKLRNILASNTGGGTMDLVWGPEIDFKESTTQIYKFLGDEKYRPVYNGIYSGMGIPPTLTGLAGQSGGYTNNFISLKTLIERLEYGRALLRQFWDGEVRYIQKAMGFSSPAVLHFDHMILNDEAAERKLLIDLADRDIISIETLRNRFNEDNKIEETRVRQEVKKREKGQMPTYKADPYHGGSFEDYKKIALQQGRIDIDDVTDIDPNPVKKEEPDSGKKEEKRRDVKLAGRPKFSKDTAPRKQRSVTPRTTAAMLWADQAQKQISNVLNSPLLAHYGKKNLRQLSKEQAMAMESIKFSVLCNIEPHAEITPESLVAVLDQNPQIPSANAQIKEELYQDFMSQNSRNPNIDELRHIHTLAYSLDFSSEE